MSHFPYDKIVALLFLFGVFQVSFVDTYLLWFEDWSWTGNYYLLRNSISEGKMITVFGAHNYSAYAYTALFISGRISNRLSNMSKLLLLVMLLTLESGTAYLSISYILLSSVSVTRRKIFIGVLVIFVTLVLFIIFFSDRVFGDASNGLYSRLMVNDSAWILNLLTVMNSPFGIGFNYYLGGDSGFLSIFARFGWLIGALLNLYIFRIIRKKFSLGFAIYTLLLSVFLPVTISIQMMLLLFILNGNSSYYKK
ncbi:hypothetical protein OAM98_03780 [Schleiferiaceae bacterium]|nr:hypothetical protein [Schleiferiaceae bacterium]